MMAAAFLPGSPPRIGRPHALFALDTPDDFPWFTCAPYRCYDVAADGQGFYAVQTPNYRRPPAVTRINLLLNWFDDLKAKVPPSRQ